MRTSCIIVAAVVLGFASLLSGDSSAGTSRTTDARFFLLELELDPSEPVVGTNAAVIVVKDGNTNQNVDDAVIAIDPWMTVHGHGTPKKTVVTKAGNGRYRIDNIFYTMEGDWDLLVTVRKGERQDTATIPVVNVKRK